MTQILTVALMGLFLLSAPASAVSETDAVTLPVTGPAYHVSLTGYNAVPSQTDSSPFTTASGAYSNPDIVAARSQDLAKELPFGTIIDIELAHPSNSCGFGLVHQKIGLRVIADAMNPKMHNKVDVLFGANDTVTMGNKHLNAARVLGLCKVTVRVVGHVAIAHIPKTQQELARLVGSDSLAFNK